MQKSYIETIVLQAFQKKDSVMIYSHIKGVKVESTFSECNDYRYELSIEKTDSQGTETVCVIMQNPSVANDEIADKSVQFLEKLIFQKSYPQFSKVKKIVIVNQFAYVQTNGFTGIDKHIGSENDKYITQAVNDADISLVAWGRSNIYRERQISINAILKSSSCKNLLRTKSHPSRGTYKDFVEEYRI